MLASHLRARVSRLRVRAGVARLDLDLALRGGARAGFEDGLVLRGLALKRALLLSELGELLLGVELVREELVFLGERVGVRLQVLEGLVELLVDQGEALDLPLEVLDLFLVPFAWLIASRVTQRKRRSYLQVVAAVHGRHLRHHHRGPLRKEIRRRRRALTRQLLASSSPPLLYGFACFT